MSAARTSLAGIGGSDKHNWNTSNGGFVPNKEPELVKRPIVRSTSFRFASWLLVKTAPNPGQVLKGQGRTRLSSFCYQLLTDVVVQPFLKATFSARKPSQQPPRVALAKRGALSARAFALNIPSNSTKSIPSRLDLRTAPRFTCGGSGNIPSTQIDPNYFGGLARWWSVYLNYKVDVIVTFLGLTQGGTGQVLTPKQSNLVPPNGQLKVNSSTFERYSHKLFGLHISKCANIQANRSGSKLVDLFDSFGVTNYPSNRLANMVSLKSCCFSYWFVDLVVKLGCVPAVLLFGYCQYLITSVSKALQSVIDFGAILYGDYKLAFNRQGLTHATIISHPRARRLKSQPAFLSALKRRSFRRGGCP